MHSGTLRCCSSWTFFVHFIFVVWLFHYNFFSFFFFYVFFFFSFLPVFHLEITWWLRFYRSASKPQWLIEFTSKFKLIVLSQAITMTLLIFVRSIAHDTTPRSMHVRCVYLVYHKQQDWLRLSANYLRSRKKKSELIPNVGGGFNVLPTFWCDTEVSHQ